VLTITKKLTKTTICTSEPKNGGAQQQNFPALGVCPHFQIKFVPAPLVPL